MRSGDYYDEFGERVIALMEKAHMSTREAAEKTGLSQTRICRLRKGWLPRKEDTIARFACAVGEEPKALWRFVLQCRVYLAVRQYVTEEIGDPSDAVYRIGREAKVVSVLKILLSDERMDFEQEGALWDMRL